MIEDIEWNQVNGLGPNQNPNYPSNDNAIYTPSRAIDLAALNPAAAIQNASNYQWYIMGMQKLFFRTHRLLRCNTNVH